MTDALLVARGHKVMWILNMTKIYQYLVYFALPCHLYRFIKHLRPVN